MLYCFKLYIITFSIHFIKFYKIRAHNTLSLHLIKSHNELQPHIYDYEPNILEIADNDFLDALFLKSDSSSGSIDITNILIHYNEYIQKQFHFIKLIINNFKITRSAEQLLEIFIHDFNSRSRIFSRNVENACLDLMIKSKENNVFEQWNDIDSLKETDDKIKQLVEEVHKNNELQNNVIGSAFGAVLTSVVSPITGDFATPAAYIATLGDSMWGLIRSAKTTIDEKNILLDDYAFDGLNAFDGRYALESQRVELENKIFVFSKMYCSFGYNLQLHSNASHIEIVGDKIEYKWMIDLINTLEKNLAFQITKLTLLNVEVNQLSLDILVSTYQRLGVLKTITDTLYSIVNYASKVHLLKITTFPGPNSLYEFQSYFNDRLTELNKLVELIEKQFPKQFEDLKAKQTILEEQIEIELMEDVIVELTQNSISNSRQRAADRKARELSHWWNSTKTYGQVWMDLETNMTRFGGNCFGKFVGSIIEAGSEAPLQAVRSIFKAVNNLLLELVLSPAGWIAIGICIFALSFMFGGLTFAIKIVMSICKYIVTVIWTVVSYLFSKTKY